MRRRRDHKRGAAAHALVALLAGAASVLYACGDGESSELAELAPPDAPLYAEVVLRPDSEQADAIEALASQAAGVDDPAAMLVAGLDASLAGDGLEITYAEDIRPWLGERGAFFVRSFEEDAERAFPDFAALIEVEDTGEAEEFLDRLADSAPTPPDERTYGDSTYLYGADDGGFAAGIVEETLVIGTEASFQLAVDSAAGESLAESDEFSERTHALGDDHLASVFLEPSSVVEAAITSGELSRRDARVVRPLFAGVGSGPLGAGVGVDADSADIEVAAMVENSDAVVPDADLLGELPAGAAFAVALPHLGETLELAFDKVRTSGLPGAESLRGDVERFAGVDLSADVASWLGDVSAFVAGSSPADLVVGLVAGTSDAEGPRALLEAARSRIEREEPGVPIGAAPEGADYGFAIGIPGIGPQAGAGVFGDELVAVLGSAPADVLEPPEVLADDELFGEAREALGGDFDPLLYLDLPELLPFLRAGGADEGRDYAEAEPYFEALRYLIAGARIEGELATVRFSVALP